jgi:hypothetical protein
MTNKPTLTLINEKLNKELASPQVMTQLLATTFNGFTPDLAKSAMVEGMVRGFEFKDFLEKNIYAIKYGNTYSLITSIDYARKIGMRSGVCGVSKPIYQEDEKGGIISCEVTIKRKVGDTIGEYTAEVYFKEYSSGRNLWATKPRTMIAKVAEMHALRKACPEEMSQMYTEEEMETIKVEPVNSEIETIKEQLANINDIDTLREFYKENSGKGAEVAKLITEKSNELKSKMQ